MRNEEEKTSRKFKRIVNKNGPYIWMLTTIDENKNKIIDNNKNKNPPIRVYYDFNVCAQQWKWKERKKEQWE